MKALCLVLVLVPLVTVRSLAEAPAPRKAEAEPRPPPPGGPAFQALPEYWVLLRTSGSFCGVTIHDSENLSQQLVALRMLLENAQAGAAFQDLLERAPVAGKLYALCGLFFTDYAAFRAAAGTLEAMEGETVDVPYTCLGDAEVPVREIVRSEGPRVVRLLGPGDTITAWLKRQPDWPEGIDPELDILGGGIPCEFRGPEGPWGTPCPPLELKASRRNLADALEKAASAGPEADEGLSRAARALGRDAVPALVAGLRHESAAARCAAAGQLAQIGPWAGSAAAALAELLARDPDPDVRVEAADAISSIGPWAAGAWPALSKVIEGLPPLPIEMGEEAEAAAAAAIPGWQSAVFELAGSFVEDTWPQSSPYLERLLRHPSERVRLDALIVVRRLGPAAGGAGAVLADLAAVALAEESSMLRREAGRALGRLGPAAAPTLPRLRRALREDPAADVRAACAHAIGCLDDAGKEAAADLRAALADRAAGVRGQAALALWKLVDEHAGTLEVFLEWLALARDSGQAGPPRDDGIDDYAMEYAGPEARGFLARLVQDDPTAFAALLDHVRSKDKPGREVGIELLADLGSRAAAAAPLLRAIEADAEDADHLRAMAAEALWDVAADAGPGVSLHLSRHRAGGRKAAPAALRALERYGPAARSALPVLLEALEGDDLQLAGAAAAVIERIGPGARAAVPALWRRLEKEEQPEQAVITALGAIGPDARAALPALERALRDESPYLRLAAREAIARIRGAGGPE